MDCEKPELSHDFPALEHVVVQECEVEVPLYQLLFKALVQVATNPEATWVESEWNLTSIVVPDVTSAGVEMPETPSSKTVELVEVPS